ncbi:PREDICTED: ovostatin-like [Gavialis gangeticus]|uniref:ovostatin-like n=1 Tax=Gavialis gangeticus TaxID=94835 RepID=UPI00092F90B9|nr:PREDICTED: ovostatin-like [Gavialis gangeticus]
MWSRIFLSILFLHLTAAEFSEPQYVLLVPAVVQSGNPQSACLLFYNLREPVALSIILEYNEVNTTLLDESVTKNAFFKCTTFMVPPAGSHPLAFITFSVTGATIKLSERRSVAIQNTDNIVFIQTDKPIYKPGQTVMIRVVALDRNFKPAQETYPQIILKDPRGNHIFQWLETTSTKSIVELSFPLTQEPILGSYSIVVTRQSGQEVHHSFNVDEYVLPKFEVSTKTPGRVSLLDQEFKVNVCASYTYGQPVQGNVQLSVCNTHYYRSECDQEPKKICERVNEQLGKDGCLTKAIPTSKFQLFRYRPRMYVSLRVDAVVTENGTGVQISSSDSVFIYEGRKSIWFQNMDQYYKRGLPYFGQINLKDEEGNPIANEIIHLELSGMYLANYTTDKNGAALFYLNTSNLFDPRLELRAKYVDCSDFGWTNFEDTHAVFYIRRFYSRTNSFVKIEPEREQLSCGQQKAIMVHYILNKDGYGDATSMNFYYVVLAKGTIVLSGTKEVNMEHDFHGIFTIQLPISEKLAPNARLMVYTVHPHREVVADSTYLNIELCFKNKVQLQFSEKQGLPGSDVSLHLEAAANSYCALRAIDQSVLLLNPGRELSPETIYSELDTQNLYGYYYQGLDLEDGNSEPCIPYKNAFFNGLYYVPVNVSHDGDVYMVFRDLGLKIFTNSTIRKPVVCKTEKACPEEDERDKYPEDARVFSNAYGGSEMMINTIRTFFPETWIWKLVPTDSAGKADISLVIPDTITEWKASAFCLQDYVGFGISPTVSLRAFQPFFVDPTLPYSIVRGERFNLIANVFNYMDTCSLISAVLAKSDDYKAEVLTPKNNVVEVCANERKTYIWAVSPHKLGEVNFTITAETRSSDGTAGNGPSANKIVWKDTIIQKLLVEPEGIKKEVTQSDLMCTKGQANSGAISLKLPLNVVDGSARVYFSVTGDILGSTLRNMENLLHMPYGCAEQNMARFTPNIYILDYLNKTGQLTKEIRDKGIGYLASGYQKQLSYKRADGSYSTFGDRDEQGNVWLTAFVYKSFAEATCCIYIDSQVQQQTLIWLSKKQNPDGCFQKDGNHFNNALKGGDSGLSLTAYVIAAFLEAGHSTSHTVVQNGLKCLEAVASNGVTNLYDQALLAYTYGLAGNKAKHRFFLDKLDKSATKIAGWIYWELTKKPPPGNSPFYLQASSAEIELTNYVLLALLNQSTTTPKDLSYMSQIVQWVVKQQNPYGGFSSSQDTVVAIRALAKYAYLTFSKDGQNTVEIKSKNLSNKVFQVNNKNRFLLQQTSLPSVPGEYKVEVNGKGCVYMQTTLRYNIHMSGEDSRFSLSAQPTNASCTSNFPPKFDLVISASYAGQRSESNMAIIDVKMLSGFVPIKSSLQELQNSRVVMHVETKNDHVIFYLEKVSQEGIRFSFSIEQSLPISNIQPASVLIYDYYQTDESKVAVYNTPCKEASI